MNKVLFQNCFKLQLQLGVFNAGWLVVTMALVVKEIAVIPAILH